MNSSNGDVNTTSMDEDEPSSTVVGFYWMCTLWTLISNLCVLTFFFRNRKKAWTDFTEQTCSMAVSDLLVGLSASQMFFMVLAAKKRISYAFCVTATHLHFSLHLVTLYHVLGICLYRNIRLKSLFQPLALTYQRINTKYVKLVSWASALLVALLPMAIWRDNLTKEMHCSTENVFSNKNKILYVGIVLLVPQCLTNILYLLICLRLWHAIRKTAPLPNIVKVFTTQMTKSPDLVRHIPDTKNPVLKNIADGRAKCRIYSLNKAVDTTFGSSTIDICKSVPNTKTQPGAEPMLTKYKKINGIQAAYELPTVPSETPVNELLKKITTGLSTIDEQPILNMGSMRSLGRNVFPNKENDKETKGACDPDLVLDYRKQTASIHVSNASSRNKQSHTTLLSETIGQESSLAPPSINTQGKTTKSASNSSNFEVQNTRVSLSSDENQSEMNANVSNVMHSLVLRVRTQYHKKVIKTIGILLLLFNVFTLPLTAGFLMGGPKDLNTNARMIVMALSVVNSGINPVVAVLRIDTLNASVRKCLEGLRRKICHRR